MKSFAFMAIAIAIAQPSIAGDPKARKACVKRVDSLIEQVDARMRQRYSAAEGEHLREQRRKLQDERERCRKL